MRKSKIIKVNEKDLIREDKKIDTKKLDEALDSISRDAVKVNNQNYLASRRFRVNTVKVEKAFKVMRENSPVKKKTKKS